MNLLGSRGTGERIQSPSLLTQETQPTYLYLKTIYARFCLAIYSIL
jgi:hypothetical protein